MAMVMNRTPAWKNILIVIVVILGTLYSLPNMFGEDFAIQVSTNNGREISKQEFDSLAKDLENTLLTNNISIKAIEQQPSGLLVRLNDAQEQLLAKTWVMSKLGEDYIVALNLASSTPNWLKSINAEPMKLGLDLRGGVHFLMEVDVKTAVVRYLESDLEEIRKQLREQNIRYRGVTMKSGVDNDKQISIRFKSEEELAQADSYLRQQFPHLVFVRDESNASAEAQASSNFNLLASFSEPEKIRIRNYAMDQSIATLRKRVNELGVAEAIVQRQGTNRVVVELPGIQDTARAKDIIGKTATVEFRLAYPGNGYGETPPVGYTLLPERNKSTKVAVKHDVIISGESIIGAYADVDNQSGRPAVAVTLGGSSAPIRKFSQVTLENKGNPMASVYVETKLKDQPQADGTIKQVQDITKDVISVATIQSALGKRFQITGLSSMQEAKNLALLLRAGALPAPVNIVAERTIGPSLGKENIQMGINSVVLGLFLVLAFMTLYYRVFGIIANIALLMNLVILVSICSIIHVTMTLPGIAGIVLTLGMAVDANVLIFERIREEIRLGSTMQASIKAGYEKAFATIVDSNVTTLIAAVILFSIGSGPVKGFAVTLSIGLLTSMFTAITGSRALVNAFFGNKRLSALPIGI